MSVSGAQGGSKMPPGSSSVVMGNGRGKTPNPSSEPRPRPPEEKSAFALLDRSSVFATELPPLAPAALNDAPKQQAPVAAFAFIEELGLRPRPRPRPRPKL